MVIRVSRGRFDPAIGVEVARLASESEDALREPIEALPGLIHYYVGTDSEAGAIVNVSVWESLADAKAMETLAEMRAQRPILEAAGVTFEPITNQQVQWQIEPG